MNMHWEQAAREALALVPLDGASEEIRAKVEAVLAAPQGAYVAGVSGGLLYRLKRMVEVAHDRSLDGEHEECRSLLHEAMTEMLAAAPQPERVPNPKFDGVWRAASDFAAEVARDDKYQQPERAANLAEMIAEKTAQIEPLMPDWSYRQPEAITKLQADAQRYQRLQILGAAPGNYPGLEQGLVLRFQSLDAFVDADIKAHPSRGEPKPERAAAEVPGYERAAFEAWYADNYDADHFGRTEYGYYVNGHVSGRWRAWQAALAQRAAAEVHANGLATRIDKVLGTYADSMPAQAYREIEAVRAAMAQREATKQEDARDAARYRALRDERNQLCEDDISVSDSSFNAYFSDELDAAVDALITRSAAIAQQSAAREGGPA